MQPRNLRAIFQKPTAQRTDIIAEGLGLLTEHVGALHQSLLQLGDDGRRGATVIEAFAREEAAKVLILLDLTRSGWSDKEAAAQQIKYLYEHLARGIYVRHYDYRPADFAEVCEYVEDLRQKYYLDGPNDFDFIFRNAIEANREDSLYVDYVTGEGGTGWWTTPASHDQYGVVLVSGAITVALALQQVGATTRAGLDVVADVWKAVDLKKSTHWGEILEINGAAVEALYNAGLFAESATDEHVHQVLHHWSFPLFGLDLLRSSVSLGDLKARREELEGTALAQEAGYP
ncbi:hypothetical protein ACIQF6_28620 [Kitasatospora sp. NPDC092948]|uniref:hypothetical protein n=1 Tax=Kitasatospora sp. NPDC092948 TaxID=3364088 RepID=UPI0038105357